MLLKLKIALLIMILPQAVHAASAKVAVIVSEGDKGGPFAATMLELEKAAVQTYTNLGYEVVTLGGASAVEKELTRSSLIATLSNLKGVQDLRLDFIGHGGLISAAPSALSYVPISESRRKILDGVVKERAQQPVQWAFANYSTLDHLSLGKLVAQTFYPEVNNTVLTQDVVVQGLRAFHEGNPSGIATINLLNCYSGSLAHILRYMPNTVVFANAPAFEIASGFGAISGRTNQDALSLYYSILASPNSKGKSIAEVRNQANSLQRKNIDEFKAYGVELLNTVGHSPATEFMLGWCEQRHHSAAQPVLNAARQAYVNAAYAEIEVVQRQLQNFMASPYSRDRNLSEQKASEDEYQSCLKRGPRKVGDSYVEDSSVDEGYLLKHQLDGYDKILNTPSDHERIFQSFKVYLKFELVDLARRKINLEDLGLVGRAKSEMESGQISSEDLVRALKLLNEKIKTACAAGSTQLAPCSDYEDTIISMGDFLLDPMKVGYQCPNSSNKVLLDCIFAKNAIIGSTDFAAYLDILHTHMVPAEQYCSSLTIPQSQRLKANLDLDQKCIHDFASQATESEWKWLESKAALANRAAR